MSGPTAVLVHGGFHGGWCWKLVAEPLRAAGWTVFTPTPTLTGSGDRVHLDAVVPADGQDLLDVVGDAEGLRATYRAQAAAAAYPWLLEPLAFDAAAFGVEDPERREWVDRHLTADTLRAWEEPLAVGANWASVPQDLGHNVMVIDPGRVVDLLVDAARRSAR